jgi:hypothetical protein
MLTAAQFEHLEAIQFFCDGPLKKTTTHKMHWDGDPEGVGFTYKDLSEAGLIHRYSRNMRGFGKDFFTCKITEEGRKKVAEYKAQTEKTQD